MHARLRHNGRVNLFPAFGVFLFGSHYFANGSSESFFKTDDFQSVKSGLSENGALTVICPVCTVRQILCHFCTGQLVRERLYVYLSIVKSIMKNM